MHGPRKSPRKGQYTIKSMRDSCLLWDYIYGTPCNYVFAESVNSSFQSCISPDRARQALEIKFNIEILNRPVLATWWGGDTYATLRHVNLVPNSTPQLCRFGVSLIQSQSGF